MGLSASQARLLSLTARLSDLELKAQSISNAKIRLADMSEQASVDYSKALDEQKIKVYSGLQPNGTSSYIDATAANLTTYNAISTTDKQRFIKNSAGQVLVTDRVKQAYDDSKGSLSAFLAAMTGKTDQTSELADSISKVQNNIAYTTAMPNGSGAQATVTTDTSVASELMAVRTDLQKISQASKTNFDTLIKGLDYAIAWCSDTVVAIDQDVLKLIFTGNAGTASGEDIGSYLKGRTGLQTSDFSENNNLCAIRDSFGVDTTDAETKYYTNLFNEIQSGGYLSPGNANMNDSKWLTNQSLAGNIFLYEYDPTGGKQGTGDFVNVSWSSGDSSLQTQTDKTDLAKAEANYQTTMASIQSKDKRFDLELTQIDTEHTAIQTEIDSVKKVMDKNIERSFKIFDA